MLRSKELNSLPPGSTVGIIGNGQLGKLLSISASLLGFRVCIYSQSEPSIASQVSSIAVEGSLEDKEKLSKFARLVDVVTCETENVPFTALEFLKNEGKIVLPDPNVFRITQDRLLEKKFLTSLGIANTLIDEVNSLDDLLDKAKKHPPPWIIKTRRMGYDGKGQEVVKTEKEITQSWDKIGKKESIIEKIVDFAYEISVIAFRDYKGRIGYYDICENVHEKGILRQTSLPSRYKGNEPYEITKKILDSLDYVGVIGVEMFVDRSGSIYVNEIAPRVHNTGHWTLDACTCSQFEQHIRLICGWPSGSAERSSRVEMRNILGDELKEWHQMSTIPNSKIYIYGKEKIQPNRKMGHITIKKN